MDSQIEGEGSEELGTAEKARQYESRMFAALMIALLAAIVGGIVGAYVTKSLTPNPMPEIKSIHEARP